MPEQSFRERLRAKMRGDWETTPIGANTKEHFAAGYEAGAAAALRLASKETRYAPGMSTSADESYISDNELLRLAAEVSDGR